MPRNILEDAERITQGAGAKQHLFQVRSLCQSAKSHISNLAAIKATIQAGVASGKFDQADLDALVAVQAPLVALNSAAQTAIDAIDAMNL